jgi:hypothetical protein
MSIFKNLNAHGRIGVDALSRATPIDSGLTASSWKYRIITDKSGIGLEWYNTNANVAILIQYGHGTGTGGYVAGVDYINPTIKPIFDNIVNEIRKQVT